MFIIHLFIHVYYSLIDTCSLLIACVSRACLKQARFFSFITLLIAKHNLIAIVGTLHNTDTLVFA